MERELGRSGKTPSEEAASTGERLFQVEGIAYAVQRGLQNMAPAGKPVSGTGTAGAKGLGWECVQQVLETVQGWRFPAGTVGAEIFPKWRHRARLEP